MKMYKTANKDASSTDSVSPSASVSGSLSSKAGKLRVTPEGGLSLVEDGGVLGKGSHSNSQQGQKQKFFATRSADGSWNLLMAPTSDPSRIFLVQPAPGHKFQVAGGGVRMESMSTSSAEGTTGNQSSANGCDEQQLSSPTVPKSTKHCPSTSKSVAVPLAQLRSSSSVSSLSSTHTTTACTPTNVATTTTTAISDTSCNPNEQKRPSFFKSRSASDREALKASIHLGKKVLGVPRRGGKSSIVSTTGQVTNQGKKSKTTRATTLRSHKNTSPVSTTLQESALQNNSLTPAPHDTADPSTMSTTLSSSSSTIGMCVTSADSITTVSSAQTQSTSLTQSSSSSSVRKRAGSFDCTLYPSPSTSPLRNSTPDVTPPSSPHSLSFASDSLRAPDPKTDLTENTKSPQAHVSDSVNCKEKQCELQHTSDTCECDVSSVQKDGAVKSDLFSESLLLDIAFDEFQRDSFSSKHERRLNTGSVCAAARDPQLPHQNLDVQEKSTTVEEDSSENKRNASPVSQCDRDVLRRDTSEKSPAEVSPSTSLFSLQNKDDFEKDATTKISHTNQSCAPESPKADTDVLSEHQNVRNSIETAADKRPKKNVIGRQQNRSKEGTLLECSSDTDDYEFVASDIEMETAARLKSADSVNNLGECNALGNKERSRKQSVDPPSEEISKDTLTLSTEEVSQASPDHVLVETQKSTNKRESDVEYVSTDLCVNQNKTSVSNKDDLDEVVASSADSDCHQKQCTSETEDDLGVERHVSHQENELPVCNTISNPMSASSVSVAPASVSSSLVVDVYTAGCEDTVSSQQGQPRKRKTRTSEFHSLIDSCHEHSEVDMTTTECVSPLHSDLSLVKSQPKKRKKRKSELEALIETQEIEKEKAKSLMEDREQEEEDLFDNDGDDKGSKDSHLLLDSNMDKDSVSGPKDQPNIKLKQKKKKKQKLKIFINLSEAKAANTSKSISTSEHDDTLPDTSSDIPLDGQTHSSNCESEQSGQKTPPPSTEDASDKNNSLSEFSEGNKDTIFKEHLYVSKADKVKKKKKKKNKKLKIIFGGGKETSTREISVSVSPDSVLCETLNDATDASGSQSVDNLHTDPGPGEGGHTADSESAKPKKKRKKRLTELETLIHDQEILSRHEGNTAEKDPDDGGDDHSNVGPQTVDSVQAKDQETCEENESETQSFGAVRQGTSEIENELPTLSCDTVGTNVQQQPVVAGRVEKTKKKQKKKKKTAKAGVIVMPPTTIGTDNDESSPVTNPADRADSTAGVNAVDESFSTGFALSPKSQGLPVEECVEMDENDEVRDAHRAMAKFLKSRSFSEWELAGMFGTPFVVLERLSEQDVYFMSRRFRNARVSSRARCSDHCRMRTLGYLCELNLIKCRPPPGYKRKVQDVMQEDANTDEPLKKKKKKKDAEEIEVGEKKRKKKTREQSGDKDGKSGSDDVIVIDSSDKTAKTSTSNKEVSRAPNSTVSLPRFPSATFGRIVRMAPPQIRPNFILASPSQSTASVGQRFVTIPPLATSGSASVPQVITIPSFGSTTRASSLPQVITIPSLGTASSTTSKIIIPPMLAKTTPSLKDATRATLTQAISNSLSKTKVVTPCSTSATPLTLPSSLLTALSRNTPVLPKASPVIPAPVTCTTVTTTQSSSAAPKQFFVVQMGDKRVLVPATALTSTTTTPTTLSSTRLAAPLTTTTTTPAATALQSLVSACSLNTVRSTTSLPSVITTSAPAVRPTNPASLIPGSMARIVLSNRRTSAPAPRTGPTASTLLFANRPAARPNQPWAGPRTVDSHKRVMVSPASQPQGIRVVLSGAGTVSSGTRFTVSASRSGVFVSSRQPTSLVKLATPGQSRPGKRVMTEEERMRKRARLEKKYPLPPGVVIKTEPATQGYGDEPKTVQTSSASSRVYVSTVPIGTGTRSQVNLNQPIPVLSALRGNPIVIRQAVPSGSLTQRPPSLLSPLIIRVPHTSTCTSISSSSTGIAATPVVTATSLLSSSSIRLANNPSSSSPFAISLLNTRSTLTSVTSSATTTVTSLRTSIPSTVVQTSSIQSSNIGSTTAVSSTISNADAVATSRSTSSTAVANETASSTQQSNDSDDAIYIADSPPLPTSNNEENVSPSQSAPLDSSVVALDDVPVTVSLSSVETSGATSPVCIMVTSPSSVSSTSVNSSTVTALTSTSPSTVTALTSTSPSTVTTSSPSPAPSNSTSALSSRMASLGAMWVRQAAESPSSIPTINTQSLQSERMQRLKETLAKQMENIRDMRHQKALQALHQQFCQTASSAENSPAGISVEQLGSDSPLSSVQDAPDSSTVDCYGLEGAEDSDNRKESEQTRDHVASEANCDADRNPEKPVNDDENESRMGMGQTEDHSNLSAGQDSAEEVAVTASEFPESEGQQRAVANSVRDLDEVCILEEGGNVQNVLNTDRDSGYALLQTSEGPDDVVICHVDGSSDDGECETGKNDGVTLQDVPDSGGSSSVDGVNITDVGVASSSRNNDVQNVSHIHDGDVCGSSGSEGDVHIVHDKVCDNTGTNNSPCEVAGSTADVTGDKDLEGDSVVEKDCEVQDIITTSKGLLCDDDITSTGNEDLEGDSLITSNKGFCDQDDVTSNSNAETGGDVITNKDADGTGNVIGNRGLEVSESTESAVTTTVSDEQGTTSSSQESGFACVEINSDGEDSSGVNSQNSSTLPASDC